MLTSSTLVLSGVRVSSGEPKSRASTPGIVLLLPRPLDTCRSVRRRLKSSDDRLILGTAEFPVNTLTVGGVPSADRTRLALLKEQFSPATQGTLSNHSIDHD